MADTAPIVDEIAVELESGPVHSTSPPRFSGGNNTTMLNGTVVYQTDSGLTVLDTTGANQSTGTPFVDGSTVTLPGLVLSARQAGDATVTVDQRNGTRTRLSALDVGVTNVTANASAKPPIRLGGGLTTISYRDPTFDSASGSPTADLEYEANTTAVIAYPDSGLPSGTTVRAVDAASGKTTLDSASVGPAALLVFTLPPGTYSVDLTTTDETTPTATATPTQTATRTSTETATPTRTGASDTKTRITSESDQHSPSASTTSGTIPLSPTLAVVALVVVGLVVHSRRDGGRSDP